VQRQALDRLDPTVYGTSDLSKISSLVCEHSMRSAGAADITAESVLQFADEAWDNYWKACEEAATKLRGIEGVMNPPVSIGDPPPKELEALFGVYLALAGHDPSQDLTRKKYFHAMRAMWEAGKQRRPTGPSACNWLESTILLMLKKYNVPDNAVAVLNMLGVTTSEDAYEDLKKEAMTGLVSWLDMEPPTEEERQKPGYEFVAYIGSNNTQINAHKERTAAVEEIEAATAIPLIANPAANQWAGTYGGCGGCGTGTGGNKTTPCCVTGGCICIKTHTICSPKTCGCSSARCANGKAGEIRMDAQATPFSTVAKALRQSARHRKNYHTKRLQEGEAEDGIEVQNGVPTPNSYLQMTAVEGNDVYQGSISAKATKGLSWQALTTTCILSSHVGSSDSEGLLAACADPNVDQGTLEMVPLWAIGIGMASLEGFIPLDCTKVVNSQAEQVIERAYATLLEYEAKLAKGNPFEQCTRERADMLDKVTQLFDVASVPIPEDFMALGQVTVQMLEQAAKHLGVRVHGTPFMVRGKTVDNAIKELLSHTREPVMAEKAASESAIEIILELCQVGPAGGSAIKWPARGNTEGGQAPGSRDSDSTMSASEVIQDKAMFQALCSYIDDQGPGFGWPLLKMAGRGSHKTQARRQLLTGWLGRWLLMPVGTAEEISNAASAIKVAVRSVSLDEPDKFDEDEFLRGMNKVVREQAAKRSFPKLMQPSVGGIIGSQDMTKMIGLPGVDTVPYRHYDQPLDELKSTADVFQQFVPFKIIDYGGAAAGTTKQILHPFAFTLKLMRQDELVLWTQLVLPDDISPAIIAQAKIKVRQMQPARTLTGELISQMSADEIADLFEIDVEQAQVIKMGPPSLGEPRIWGKSGHKDDKTDGDKGTGGEAGKMVRTQTQAGEGGGLTDEQTRELVEQCEDPDDPVITSKSTRDAEDIVDAVGGSNGGEAVGDGKGGQDRDDTMNVDVNPDAGRSRRTVKPSAVVRDNRESEEEKACRKAAAQAAKATKAAKSQGKEATAKQAEGGASKAGARSKLPKAATHLGTDSISAPAKRGANKEGADTAGTDETQADEPQSAASGQRVTKHVFGTKTKENFRAQVDTLAHDAQRCKEDATVGFDPRDYVRESARMAYERKYAPAQRAEYLDKPGMPEPMALFGPDELKEVAIGVWDHAIQLFWSKVEAQRVSNGIFIAQPLLHYEFKLCHALWMRYKGAFDFEDAFVRMFGMSFKHLFLIQGAGQSALKHPIH
jgi:hypothetical protein